MAMTSNDPDAISSSEAVSDGRGNSGRPLWLGHERTNSTGQTGTCLDTAAVAKLGAISATSVLAALSASPVHDLTGNTAQAADTAGGGGLLSIIIAAVLKGFMQSAQRQLAPKRRRRRVHQLYGSPPHHHAAQRKTQRRAG